MDREWQALCLLSFSISCFPFHSEVTDLTYPHLSCSAYGEGVFLLLQTAFVGALVFLYGGSMKKAVLFFVTVTSIAVFLSSGLLPMKFLWVLQASNIPIVFSGKVRNDGGGLREGGSMCLWQWKKQSKWVWERGEKEVKEVYTSCLFYCFFIYFLILSIKCFWHFAPSESSYRDGHDGQASTSPHPEVPVLFKPSLFSSASSTMYSPSWMYPSFKWLRSSIWTLSLTQMWCFSHPSFSHSLILF